MSVYCTASQILCMVIIPGLTRNPLPAGRQECFQSGFPLEFIPMKIGAGMTASEPKLFDKG
jgi:hypothetical protein